jgi:hypothetical protein
MPYRIAGIDVHKKMLAVVVADVEVDGDFHFERQKAGTTPSDLRGLAAWLVAQEVEEVVMESTAQYWRPVWETLEQHWRPQRRARRCAAPVGHAPSRASAIESRARRSQEGLSGCGPGQQPLFSRLRGARSRGYTEGSRNPADSLDGMEPCHNRAHTLAGMLPCDSRSAKWLQSAVRNFVGGFRTKRKHVAVYAGRHL